MFTEAFPAHSRDPFVQRRQKRDIYIYMLCYVTLCYVFEPTSRPEDEADDPKKKVPKKTRGCWRREKTMVVFNMVLPQGLWNHDGGKMNFFNMEK